MDEIHHMIEEVFPDSQVYPTIRAVLGDRYPHITKWYRQQVSPHVATYLWIEDPQKQPETQKPKRRKPKDAQLSLWGNT